MSNLFLIGNGFDLSCGLKSSYSDMYDEYIKSKSENPLIQKFKDEIASDYATWGDFEIAMGQYSKKIDSEKDFILCIRDFKSFMSELLHKEQAAFFNSWHGDTFIQEALKKEMEESIKAFYGGCSQNNINAAKNNILTHGNSYKFISFNYTDVFDDLMRLTSISDNANLVGDANKVLHIHGNLFRSDITLGVDNDDQIAANYVIKRNLENAFIKPKFNDNYDSTRVEQAKTLIANASNICIYGMSMGDSDLTWRRAILDSLRIDSQKQVFYYDYKLSHIDSELADEKMELQDDKKEELMARWGAEEYEDEFKRIHIPCGHDIFNIKIAINKGYAQSITSKERGPRIVKS